MTSKNAPAVILGASYAAHWPIEQLAGHPVVNRGIGGNESFDMHERFDEDVVALEPAKVLIWGFINDIFRAEPGKMEETKQRIQSGYKAMVAAAEKEGIEVILATEVSIRGEAGFANWAASVIGDILGKTSYQSMINGHVKEVNIWLKDFARSKGITVLDFESLLADSDGTRKSEFAVDDGSHLTAAAYATMSKYTQDALQAGRTANEVK
ncbi:GDSL-type esterase/lipase family protein [Woeseia oceani]|nr:GDSL-type esterase/lipase family protein [Woeseia oceani]